MQTSLELKAGPSEGPRVAECLMAVQFKAKSPLSETWSKTEGQGKGNGLTAWQRAGHKGGQGKGRTNA